MIKLWPLYAVVFLLLITIFAIIYFNKRTGIVSEITFTCDVVCLESRLQQHVVKLAEDIGERHFENHGSLGKTADYIEENFHQSGLMPHRHIYDQQYANIIVDIKGISEPDEIILIGAHYDTVWLSPGADDNASGIAVMLELARLLAPVRFQKTLRFAAFTNEEQPFSESAGMGSRIYAQEMHAMEEKIVAMYSLEMLGYYSDRPGSQKYPAPLAWFYPDKASFIAFIANVPSALLLVRTLAAFRKHSDFPNQGLIAPEGLIPDIRRSDHASFWDTGYPAVMVTDTADYRNMHYHTVGDVPRTLNYEKMASLTSALARMFAHLARPVE